MRRNQNRFVEGAAGRQMAEESMRKLFQSTATVGIAFSIFADPVSAGIITKDGLAGKRFCWLDDQEKFGADHSYVFYWRPGGGGFDKQYEDKGTWAISKDGTVTLKLSGGTQTRRYDIDGGRVKELTGSLFNYTGYAGAGLGKVC
jgi:hypothetical protein